MQIVINIPEEEYNMILKSDKTAMAGYVSKEAIMYAIKNGIPLSEDATNGDMIKAMFPNIKWFINEDDEVFTDHKTLNSERVALAREWWNAPYGRSIQCS